MPRYKGMFGDRPDNMPQVPKLLKKLTPAARDFLLEFAKDPHTFMERHIFYKKCLIHNTFKLEAITWDSSTGARPRLIPRELMIEALGNKFIRGCDDCLYQYIGDNG